MAVSTVPAILAACFFPVPQKQSQQDNFELMIVEDFVGTGQPAKRKACNAAAHGALNLDLALKVVARPSRGKALSSLGTRKQAAGREHPSSLRLSGPIWDLGESKPGPLLPSSLSQGALPPRT